jgi:hypothetical protein
MSFAITLASSTFPALFRKLVTSGFGRKRRFSTQRQYVRFVPLADIAFGLAKTS